MTRQGAIAIPAPTAYAVRLVVIATGDVDESANRLCALFGTGVTVDGLVDDDWAAIEVFFAADPRATKSVRPA